jgi:hypothetical protein
MGNYTDQRNKDNVRKVFYVSLLLVIKSGREL